MTIVTAELDHVVAAPSAVTIGVFDGVHRGHRLLLGRVVDLARHDDLRAVAVTFDRHPATVVHPERVPPALQTTRDKVAALAATGVDHVHVLAFDEAASREDPRDFVTRVLAGPLQARHVVVGANFRFGHQAAGDVELLAELGDHHGFTTEAVPLLAGAADGREVVSSSAIRSALAAGDVEGAAAALGRPHRLVGPVVRGDGRGRTIGVPTANVAVDSGMALPAAGVYATRVGRRDVDGTVTTWWDAVTNVGTRPTFDGRGVTVEAHLLDADVDLYDTEVVVDLVARLRGERRFDGVDALVAQIHRDVESARRALA